MSIDTENGEYTLIVPLKSKYILKIKKQGFQSIEEKVDLKNFETLQQIKKDFLMLSEK